jgi:hypothetical protein
MIFSSFFSNMQEKTTEISEACGESLTGVRDSADFLQSRPSIAP